MKRILVGGFSLVLAAAACGGATDHTGTPSPEGSATVSGTIAGKPVPTNDAIGRQLTTTTSGVTATSRTISITSVSNACGCGMPPAYLTSLSLTVGALGAAVPTGTYAFPSDGGTGGVGEAQYIVNDPMTTLLVATSGSITVSQVDSSVTAGTFDLTFPSGDHVSGSFSAPTCAATASADAACQ